MLHPGTRLTLDLPVLDEDGAAETGLPVGDPNPWSEIVVRGQADHGEAGVSLIVSPLVFSHASSPVEIDPEALEDLGYEVTAEAEAPGPWEMIDDPDEVSHTAKPGAVPQFGQPGWSKWVRERDEAAKAAEASA